MTGPLALGTRAPALPHAQTLPGSSLAGGWEHFSFHELGGPTPGAASEEVSHARKVGKLGLLLFSPLFPDRKGAWGGSGFRGYQQIASHDPGQASASLFSSIKVQVFGLHLKLFGRAET